VFRPIAGSWGVSCGQSDAYVRLKLDTTELLVDIRSGPAKMRFASIAPVRLARSRCPSYVLRAVSTGILDIAGIDAGLAYPVSGFAANLAIELPS
jgi:hypothetical protein